MLMFGMIRDMASAVDSIVTVNTGSSSLKLTIFANNGSGAEALPLSAVSVSGIGQQASMLQIMQSTSPARTKEVHAPDHLAAFRIIMENDVLPDGVVAMGHRLVHGGTKYRESTLVTAISNDDWELLAQLDPHHTPIARQLIDQITQYYPSLVQVACFDTTFFQALPRVAKTLPIPQKYYEKGVRRYGFHGLSYTSLLSIFQERAGQAAANGRVILAHLGSGASVTATHLGKPVDTTMSFTPASGVTMSTRSGDLDPSIFGFLHRQDAMSIDAFDRMVNFESGLLGVSGTTGDMKSLLNQEKESEAAALAVELFVRDIKKTIGAFCALLGGVDSLIFSGGIGEQSAVVRSRICRGLAHMGIEIDEAANEHNSFLISAEHCAVGVHVIPTNEAQVIVEQTTALLNKMDRS